MSENLRFSSVSRDSAAKCLLVGLSRRPTDDEIRDLHAYLRRWPFDALAPIFPTPERHDKPDVMNTDEALREATRRILDVEGGCCLPALEHLSFWLSEGMIDRSDLADAVNTAITDWKKAQSPLSARAQPDPLYEGEKRAGLLEDCHHDI